MKQSLGMIEVEGNVTALICADKMIKSAYVEIRSIKKIRSGIVVIIVNGDLASVQYAIEIGQEAAAEHGNLIAARVIPRPYEGLEKLTAPDESGEQ